MAMGGRGQAGSLLTRTRTRTGGTAMPARAAHHRRRPCLVRRHIQSPPSSPLPRPAAPTLSAAAILQRGGAGRGSPRPRGGARRARHTARARVPPRRPCWPPCLDQPSDGRAAAVLAAGGLELVDPGGRRGGPVDQVGCGGGGGRERDREGLRRGGAAAGPRARSLLRGEGGPQGGRRRRRPRPPARPRLGRRRAPPNQSAISSFAFSTVSLPWMTLRPTWGGGGARVSSRARHGAPQTAGCGTKRAAVAREACSTGNAQHGQRAKRAACAQQAAHLDGVVAADGAGLGRERVSRADHLAARRDDALALPDLRARARARGAAVGQARACAHGRSRTRNLAAAHGDAATALLHAQRRMRSSACATARAHAQQHMCSSACAAAHEHAHAHARTIATTGPLQM